MTHAPGYWMDETSGVLWPAVESYLRGDELTGEQIALLRAYLRQWIMADVWVGEEDVAELRDTLDLLTSHKAIQRWLARAADLGIDPL